MIMIMIIVHDQIFSAVVILNLPCLNKFYHWSWLTYYDLGWLLQSNAEQLAVGNCSFMQYYCNVREYETSFFKRLYKDPTADCG